jgi:hypothetical protein
MGCCHSAALGFPNCINVDRTGLTGGFDFDLRLPELDTPPRGEVVVPLRTQEAEL